ncbi:hypothetical protein EJB05_47839, partial [Eragrostis curvula]
MVLSEMGELAPGSQLEFADVYTEASKCVVSITRSREVHDKKSDLLKEDVKPAGTGFVVHVTDKVSVVACHTSCASKNSNVSVIFPDGTEATWNDVVVLEGGMNLIFCDVERVPPAVQVGTQVEWQSPKTMNSSLSGLVLEAAIGDTFKTADALFDWRRMIEANTVWLAVGNSLEWDIASFFVK